MEKSIRVITSGKAHLGLSQKTGALSQIAIKLSMQHILPFEMFAHGVPYEASKTYDTLKSEFESRRAVALFEMQRQALRGF
jgi:hypothetical protein